MAEATSRLKDLVKSAWADSTVKSRQWLYRRFIAWTQLHGVPANPDTACLFVVATGIKVQGMHTYSKMMSAIYRHLGEDNRPLKTLTAVLRGAGGAIPDSQALPISKELLMQWASKQQDKMLCLTAWVAWKTASRWDDVCYLPHHHFVLVQNDEVIVDWHAQPKGRRSNPFCRSKLAVIKGPLTSKIAKGLRAAGNFQNLSPWTGNKLNDEWKKDARMRGYTGHSIKRGATDHLLRAKAAGAPFPPALISRLTKHRNDADEPDIAEMTILYASDSVALARVLRTGEVTPFL